VAGVGAALELLRQNLIVVIIFFVILLILSFSLQSYFRIRKEDKALAKANSRKKALKESTDSL
jgi:isoprenylcysteine carboxyl methyltransferase (ICMT) family protein YpbQ